MIGENAVQIVAADGLDWMLNGELDSRIVMGTAEGFLKVFKSEDGPVAYDAPIRKGEIAANRDLRKKVDLRFSFNDIDCQWLSFEIFAKISVKNISTVI